jgi:hypothetical protein
MMMKKIFLCQLACITVAALFCIECYAETVSSADLIKDAKKYDGSNVVYQGEVVGDIMARNDHAWLSVNDGLNSIGIWIRAELIKNIKYVGSYHAKGDVIEVNGVFNRSCPEHGGDLDIHAKSVSVVSNGNNIVHTVNKKEINVAVGLSCMIALVWLLQAWIKKRRH